MIKIIPYQKVHQHGIDVMMDEISLEFDERLISKPTHTTPLVPGNYWVAIADEKVIGTVGVIAVENDFGVLKKMMLKKEFRGQNLGISTLLLQTVMSWCQEHNVSNLYLGTMLQFRAAQNFYERNGFKRINESHLPTNFLKNPMDKVFYLKNI